VKQQRRALAELLGTGNGQAAQVYRLKNGPLLDGTLVVEVEDATGSRWIRWSEVDGFEGSGEDDRVFVVDLESGLVRFGNGVQGLAPQIGQRIRATEYRFGGGDAGNVAAKAIKAIPALAALQAANPLPARGGAPAETIAQALERLPGELRRHDRAVTAGDFRELALATPGADLGRSEVIPLFDPRTRSTQAAGVVTVVVLPRVDRKNPNAPSPDRTTLRKVCAFLDKRRLVTTELYVIPPTYVKVGVSIAVHVKPGYGPDAVRAWVELVVRQYLAPLPPFGPDGNGWPLGRRVFGPEVEAAVLQVEGVEFVDVGGVEVGRLLPDGTFAEGPVDLAPHQLPELAHLSVVASGTRLPVGQGFTPPRASGNVVPIPTIVDEC
jgi:predicted phage baseplate assembly protein